MSCPIVSTCPSRRVTCLSYMIDVMVDSMSPNPHSDSTTLDVHVRAGKTMPEAARDRLFALFKANMKQLYSTSGWGWHPAKKKAELKDKNMLHLLLTHKVSSCRRGAQSHLVCK